MNVKSLPAQGKDDTIDPAYLGVNGRLAITTTSTGTGTYDPALVEKVNNLSSDVNTLKVEINSVKTQVTSLNNGQTQQDTKISTLESSQVEQDNKIAQILLDIENIKETLEDVATKDVVINIVNNYINTVIGREVPSSVDDEVKLAAWLAEQDEGIGLTLSDLAKRIEDMEVDIIELSDIDALFNP